MSYFIAERDGCTPKLLRFEAAARDLAAWGWKVVRVVGTEAIHA